MAKKEKVLRGEKKESSRVKVFRPREKLGRRWHKRMLGVKRQSGAALRGWRYDRNITQVQLAAAWGVSKRSIIRWEQRDALPVLVKLALEG